MSQYPDSSHRSRGAWIEISLSTSFRGSEKCRIAHAVRGLKCCYWRDKLDSFRSHRSRGAWIEITEQELKVTNDYVASLTRCVD